MHCSFPHDASTTCPAGTEPWASIQLRRRRPKAVDGLAISSQSPFNFVGEHRLIVNQGQAWMHTPGIAATSQFSDIRARITSEPRRKPSSCFDSHRRALTPHQAPTFAVSLVSIVEAPFAPRLYDSSLSSCSYVSVTTI